jgi:toxin FitB
MILVDSNIVIYAAKEEYASLRPLLLEATTCVSIITKLEALGFRHLTQQDKVFLNGLFATINVLAIDEAVINQAILLRQTRKMSLGDAIIGATALLNGFELHTRNTADFMHIPDLVVINPLDS